MKLTAIVAALAATAIAAPTERKPEHKPANNKQCKPVTANYDDLVAQAPLTTPPTPYKGLNYDGFNTQSQTLNVVPGNLQAFSPPNNIYFSDLTKLTNGVATIKPAKGTFDLQNLRFGCSINAGALRTPKDCTVLASAVDSKGKSYSTSFKFAASPNMKLVKFPKTFKNLKQVSFAQVGEDATDNVVAVSMDNLQYCLRQ